MPLSLIEMVDWPHYELLDSLPLLVSFLKTCLLSLSLSGSLWAPTLGRTAAAQAAQLGSSNKISAQTSSRARVGRSAESSLVSVFVLCVLVCVRLCIN